MLLPMDGTSGLLCAGEAGQAIDVFRLSCFVAIFVSAMVFGNHLLVDVWSEGAEQFSETYYFFIPVSVLLVGIWQSPGIWH